MQQTRRGFTLIELLIVVVIIGILAAIAIPKFADTKRKAYISAMKTDLKNLVPALEGHYSTNGANYGNFSLTGKNSPQVTLTYTHNNTQGWGANATHSAMTDATCQIWVGVIGSVEANLSEGVPGGVNCK
jgi:prepilin-type N-terminal cleavage/methylation domain-containing protein